jgi:uncharacterized protein YjbI with pentapeptide repeats
MIFGLPIKEIQYRLKLVREGMGLSRKKLCEHTRFKKYLKAFGYSKAALTEDRVKYIENPVRYPPLKNKKKDNDPKDDLKNYVLSFCYGIGFSLKQFLNSNSNEQNEYIEFRSRLKTIAKNKDTKVAEEICYENDEILTALNTKKDINNIIQKYLENTFLLSIQEDDWINFDISYNYFEKAFTHESFQRIEVLPYMSESLRQVANDCYIGVLDRNKAFKGAKIYKCPKTFKYRNIDEAHVDRNRNYCEKIIRLISLRNSMKGLPNLDFSSMDLRRLYLFNEGWFDTNNLKCANFRGSNIAYTVFAGIFLKDSCFDDILCARNATFFDMNGTCSNLKKTFIDNQSTVVGISNYEGTTFENANLKGVNKLYDEGEKGKKFVKIRGLRQEFYTEEGLERIFSFPFSWAKSLKGAELDKWLRKMVQRRKDGSL